MIFPERDNIHLAEIVDHIAAPVPAIEIGEAQVLESVTYADQLYSQAKERLSLIIRDISLGYFPSSSAVIEIFAGKFAEQKEPNSPRRAQSIRDIYAFGGHLALAKTMFLYPRHHWGEHHPDTVTSFANLLEFDQMPAEEIYYDDFESAILDDLAERMTLEVDNPRYHYEAIHIGYHNAESLGYLSAKKLIKL